MVWIIIIAVIVLLVLWFISTSNRLAKLKMKATTAFADVDTYLTQRYDVIKSMEGTIKGATKNEKNIFKEVIEARSAGLNAKTIDEKIDADNKTTQALMNFVSLTESYPELSSIKEFNTLLEDIKRLNSELVGSRRYYNAVVGKYNAAIIMIPTNIVANIMGYQSMAFYEATDEQRQNVVPNFDE